jgi:membrane associated rhomboid family serine protease
MIPLRDVTRRPVRFSIVTAAIIAVNVIVFFFELGTDEASIVRWAVVPAELSRGQHWITALTSMFMHGGFMHIIGNMVFLWAFAPAVEDTMNRGRFLFFYLLGGLAATVAQVAVGPNSTVPQLGASGAIAAVMGAFLVTYPRDRIKVVWFFGWFFYVTYIPAFVLVGIWLLSQLLNQAGAVVQADSGGIAYMAHIGGAVFGMLTARLFEQHGSGAAEVGG